MTIFEKIVAREIPAKIVSEDDDVIAFYDVNPQAPVHVLIVPKRVIPRLSQASESDQALLGKLLLTSAKVARDLGVGESGYRVVINSGPDAGESVPHLHVHLLGKRFARLAARLVPAVLYSLGGMKLQPNSAVQWLRTTRCKWLLLVTVLCLVLRENYPFSHFPMYSSFSNETYFLYLTDAAGQPIATSRLGLSSSTLKKIFDRQRRSNLKKYRKADSARFRWPTRLRRDHFSNISMVCLLVFRPRESCFQVRGFSAW